MNSLIPKPLVNSLLNRREKGFDTATWCYKLQNAPGGFGMDVPFTSDPADIDEPSMAVWVPFASGIRRDGVGDLLEVSGIDTSRHQMNPIVLYDHGKQISLPIGLTEDPLTKAYMVQLDAMARTARAKAYFYQGGPRQQSDDPFYDGRKPDYDHALFCEQLFDLVVKRYVRAGSIGYQVIAATPMPPDYMTGTPQGLHLVKTLLLEVSVVVMPANADTVRKALSMPTIAGKPPSPVLIKSLSAYAGEKTTQMGYEAHLRPHTKPRHTWPNPTIPYPTEPDHINVAAVDVVAKEQPIGEEKSLRSGQKAGRNVRVRDDHVVVEQTGVGPITVQSPSPGIYARGIRQGYAESGHSLGQQTLNATGRTPNAIVGDNRNDVGKDRAPNIIDERTNKSVPNKRGMDEAKQRLRQMENQGRHHVALGAAVNAGMEGAIEDHDDIAGLDLSREQIDAALDTRAAIRRGELTKRLESVRSKYGSKATQKEYEERIASGATQQPDVNTDAEPRGRVYHTRYAPHPSGQGYQRIDEGNSPLVFDVPRNDAQVMDDLAFSRSCRDRARTVGFQPSVSVDVTEIMDELNRVKSVQDWGWSNYDLDPDPADSTDPITNPELEPGGDFDWGPVEARNREIEKYEEETPEDVEAMMVELRRGHDQQQTANMRQRKKGDPRQVRVGEATVRSGYVPNEPNDDPTENVEQMHNIDMARHTRRNNPEEYERMQDVGQVKQKASVGRVQGGVNHPSDADAGEDWAYESRLDEIDRLMEEMLAESEERQGQKAKPVVNVKAVRMKYRRKSPTQNMTQAERALRDSVNDTRIERGDQSVRDPHVSHATPEFWQTQYDPTGLATNYDENGEPIERE